MPVFEIKKNKKIGEKQNRFSKLKIKLKKKTKTNTQHLKQTGNIVFGFQTELEA